MTMSAYDREAFDAILAGEGTWFTAQLLRLIRKADTQHRMLLRLGFPEEVDAVQAREDEAMRQVVPRARPEQLFEERNGVK